VNGVGTIYGFEWYRNQMVQTLQEKAYWLLFFVPDSPTASLFFTGAIAYLLLDQYKKRHNNERKRTKRDMFRHLIEAAAVITSIKYGLWAVIMIIAGTMQGVPFEWQHGMLIVSHLGMAVEAIIFARFMGFRKIHIIIVTVWTISNDFIDYHFGVFPGLPRVLHEYLPVIKWLTVTLSLMSILFAYISMWLRKKTKS